MRWVLGLRGCLGIALAAGCGASSEGDGTSSNADDDASGPDSGSPTISATSSIDDEGATASDPSDEAGSSAGDDATTGVGTTTATPTTDDTGETSATEESSETQGTDDATSTTGDTANQACIDGCAVEFACQATCECDTNWASEAECIEWCDANLAKAEAFSPFCEQAWEGVSACFATLTCEEFHEYHNPTMFPYPCAAEADALAFECKGQ